jgi:hypothetical protein
MRDLDRRNGKRTNKGHPIGWPSLHAGFDHVEQCRMDSDDGIFPLMLAGIFSHTQIHETFFTAVSLEDADDFVCATAPAFSNRGLNNR